LATCITSEAPRKFVILLASLSITPRIPVESGDFNIQVVVKAAGPNHSQFSVPLTVTGRVPRAVSFNPSQVYIGPRVLGESASEIIELSLSPNDSQSLGEVTWLKLESVRVTRLPTDGSRVLFRVTADIEYAGYQNREIKFAVVTRSDGGQERLSEICVPVIYYGVK
jgi:hypothetical protein